MAAKKKAELVEEAVEAGVEVEAGATVAEIREALVDAPLPRTPVDFGVYEAPVGVPAVDPGDAVAARQAEAAAEGDE